MRAVKGDAGHVVVIGGSAPYAGSPFISAHAALRVGIDRVTVICPDLGPAIAAATLEMHVHVDRRRELSPRFAVQRAVRTIERFEQRRTGRDSLGRIVVLFGAGLGGATKPRPLIHALARVRKRVPWLVIDGSLGGGSLARADLQALQPQCLLLSEDEAQGLVEDWRGPDDAASHVATMTGGEVIVKGPEDHLCSSAAGPAVISSGHPTLTKSGTGDVLTGLSAGLLARGLSARAAIERASVCLHEAAHRVTAHAGSGYLISELIREIDAEVDGAT